MPNLVAGREVVPELVPHFGGPEPLVERAHELIAEPSVAQAQRDHLAEIAQKFNAKRAGPEAADQIANLLGLPSTEKLGEVLSNADQPGQQAGSGALQG